MKHKDYKNLCELTIPIVRSTGQFIRQEALNFDRSTVIIKERNSLVSYVDKTAEEMLVSALQVLIPDAGFITEEATVHQDTKEYTWIIDPLDGTNNFIHGVPHYAVSVGLMYQDEIVMGIVLNAASDACYYAWKAGGAYLDGNPIQVSPTGSLSDAMVATGFPYRKDDVQPLIDTLIDIMKNARGLRRLGAAALDLVYVAAGHFESYYEASINAWDVAGGIIIVKEAGGQITDYSGGDDIIFGGRILATNGVLHQEFLDLISGHFSRTKQA